MKYNLNRASFKNLILSEFRKLFFLRFTKVYLICLTLFSLLSGAILVLTTNVTQGKNITELLPSDVITVTMLGVDVAAIMLIIFTALTITSEFLSKLINVSLAVTPKRKRFFLGKLSTYLLLSIVISIVISILTYILGVIILKGNGMATVSISSMIQFGLGVAIMPVFYCALTVAATFIFRSSGGAITFVLSVLSLPALIRLLSEDIQKVILPALPQSAIHNISGIVETGSNEALGLGASIIVLLVWIGVTSLFGMFQFERKDA